MLNTKRFKKFIGKASIGLALSLFITTPAHAATYKVIKGDSLYKVANLFKTNSTTIMRSNNLTTSSIKLGQTLYIPGDMYTVKAGDTLYIIAKKFGIPMYSLARANHEWDGYLYPGQKLNLPGVTSGNSTSSTAGIIPYTQSDLDLLARLVRAEAEDQPYSAKVAVAAVVVNRVQSKEFPNSIRSVIYQTINGYTQFTPVANGTINKPASQTDINAAREALKGADPSKGALFYFDDSATNKWLWSKPLAARIDDMVFVY
jgi:N-acetylmuramoyl-L-alanine amidase